MMDTTLDKLLSTVEVSPQSFSVCRIQSGWRMSFPVFTMITVHFVLRGHGQVQVGAAEPNSTVAQLGGVPETHTLGTSFFTGFPLLWGDYVAKVGVFPVPTGWPPSRTSP